jgi:TP901 family phage tail tape measure protein
MANRDLNARIIISAKDEASGVLSSLRDHAGKIATAIVGYFSFRFFKGATDDAAEFEKQMSVVKAVSGATGEELKKLEQAAKDMGDKTQYTATEAAQALEELGKAGLTSSQQIDALPQVLSLAQANGLSLADAAGFVTKTVNGMGLAFSDSARVADVLTQAAASTNTSVQGLGEGLSYAAPMAKTLGLSLEQTTAYLGKMADAGIDASRAGTALNSVMTQFLDPSTKFRSELAKLGINTQDFNQAIAQLAAKGKSGEAALLALGTEAGPGMRALLNQGIPALQDLTKKLQESSGAAATAAATMSDNLDGAVKGLGSSFDSLKLQLAQPILEPLKNAALWLTGKFQALTADGTISRLGEFIADTFNRGALAFEAFAEKIDFTAVGGAVSTFGATFKLAFNASIEIAGTLTGTIAKVYTSLNNNGAFTAFQGVAAQAVNGVVNSVKVLSEIIAKTFKTVAESPVFSQFATAATGAINSLNNAAATLSQPFINLFATITGGQATTTSFGVTFGNILIKLAQLATVFVNGFSTGLDTLAVAFHGIAGVSASFVSGVLEGIAKIQEGYALITFGDLSQRHQAAADEMHKIAESFAVSANDNYGKAKAAMDRVTQSAEVTNASLQTLAGTGLPAATGQASQTAGALNDTASAANAAKVAGDNLATGAAQWVNPQQALVNALTQQQAQLIATGASQTELALISEQLSVAQQAAQTAAEGHAAAMASTGDSAGTATANVGDLSKEVGNLPKTPKPIYINAETKEASDRISELKAPTSSTHKPEADISLAIGEIEKLKAPTSSEHTVYVRRVEVGGDAPAPAAQATGGPAGQPTGEPWHFNQGGHTPISGKLPGYGGGDKIKALLEPGEYVVRKEAVQALGLPFMALVNAGQVPVGDVIRRATGGIVSMRNQPKLDLIKSRLPGLIKGVGAYYGGGPFDPKNDGNDRIFKDLSYYVRDLIETARTPFFKGEAQSILGYASQRSLTILNQTERGPGGLKKLNAHARQRLFDNLAEEIDVRVEEMIARYNARQQSAAEAIQAKQAKLSMPASATPTVPALPAARPLAGISNALNATPLAGISQQLQQRTKALSLPMPELPAQSVPQSSQSATANGMMRVQFASPAGEKSEGLFKQSEATAMLHVLKEAGARTV